MSLAGPWGGKTGGQFGKLPPVFVWDGNKHQRAHYARPYIWELCWKTQKFSEFRDNN